MGTSFTKLRLFFYHKRIFPRLHKTLCVGRVKLFAEASELFMYAVFQVVFRKTASSECIFQGAKKMGAGGC